MVDTVAVNQNGLDLTVNDSTSATAYIGFDLSNFPTSSVTVTTGSLDVTLAAAQVGAVTIDMHEIADIDESWGETTINGNNEPASAANNQSFSIADLASGTQSIPLNSSWLSTIQSKMNAGVNFVTFLLVMSTVGGSSIFEDRESGVGTDPQLTIKFTVPK